MRFKFNNSSILAPLQRVMLRDSLAAKETSHHVEQLEILFQKEQAHSEVGLAWAETVNQTEALQVAFWIANDHLLSWGQAELPSTLNYAKLQPTSWQAWLEEDRHRSLLVSGQVPWRAIYWPNEQRFIWTFHHALLDGRSIQRILTAFLERLAGGEPGRLALAKWQVPDCEALTLASQRFRKTRPNPEPLGFDFFKETPGGSREWCCLGEAFRRKLEFKAAAIGVTVATILTWAWGQALIEIFEVAAVMVEQLRAGAPQVASAGFTMNTLPISIVRAPSNERIKNLCEFRAQLIGLRAIETVSRVDFPVGEFPDLDAPWTSVIMIEHRTLAHLVTSKKVKSLQLHECRGETLIATGYLLPDMRLEVEGPNRQRLLKAWIQVLFQPLS